MDLRRSYCSKYSLNIYVLYTPGTMLYVPLDQLHYLPRVLMIFMYFRTNKISSQTLSRQQLFNAWCVSLPVALQLKTQTDAKGEKADHMSHFRTGRNVPV